MIDHDAFINELEKAGPDEVRARILNGQYSKVGPKHDIAKDWLHRKEVAIQRETEARRDATSARAAEAALRAAEAAARAADAAEEQASQAQRANRIAAIALITAIAAAIFSLIALAGKIT